MPEHIRSLEGKDQSKRLVVILEQASLELAKVTYQPLNEGFIHTSLIIAHNIVFTQYMNTVEKTGRQTTQFL